MYGRVFDWHTLEGPTVTVVHRVDGYHLLFSNSVVRDGDGFDPLVVSSSR
jgi:hypothetical protein